VVFPFGIREKAPGDRLTHRVAQLLLVPSDTRDRLTNGIYKSARSGQPVGLMEEALPQVIHAEPLERKVTKALKKGEISGISWEDQVRDALEKKVISAEETEILLHVHELVMEIIAVDDFDVEELRLGRRQEAPLDSQHAA